MQSKYKKERVLSKIRTLFYCLFVDVSNITHSYFYQNKTIFSTIFFYFFTYIDRLGGIFMKLDIEAFKKRGADKSGT